MKKKNAFDSSFFKKLQSLSNDSFPKMCGGCGKIYENVEEYIAQTESENAPIDPGESSTGEEKPIVTLFRNCTCGTTLMDVYNDRRDVSRAGRRRREKFGELLENVIEFGLPCNAAREELLKTMRGEKSILRQTTKK
jgi:hypothetical protein